MLCFAPGFALAQAPGKAAGNTQVGRVLNDDVVVYQTADFDSPTLGKLKKDSQWTMSKQIYGAFYQVRIGKDRIGYVTDADIVPLAVYHKAKAAAQQSNLRNRNRKKNSKNSDRTSEEGKEGAHIADKKPKRRRGFENQNYQGATLTMLRYREETMGLRPTDNLYLLGFKASGNDVVVEGLPTELNVAFSLAPPKYYEQATGRASNGFLFMMDFLMLAPSQHGPNTMTYFGFGPMFKYSRFGVTVPVNGKDESYSLEDMNIGAKFNYGISQRFGNFALRLDGQYYWEKTQYYGFSVSAQIALD